eukprot:250399_1
MDFFITFFIVTRNIIAQYDADGDGKLDPQEFERLKVSITRKQEEKEASPYNNPNQKRATYQPYNATNKGPQFGGNINKVNEKEYTPHNSNAKAFGVDIFGNPNEPVKPK